MEHSKVKIKDLTPEIVEDYAKTIEFTIDGNAFLDYYEQGGWMLRSTVKVKSWTACVRTWKNRRNLDAKRNKAIDPKKGKVVTDVGRIINSL